MPGSPIRACQSLLDLTGPASPTHRDSVAFLPSSTSRETVLFEKLFPNGLTPDVDLMATFIKAIRSGQVGLEPTANSGWYEYQAFALETMLLPQRVRRALNCCSPRRTRNACWKRSRRVITKRRETHVRQLDAACIPTSAPPPFMPPPKLQVRPRCTRAGAHLLPADSDLQFPGELPRSQRGRRRAAQVHGLRRAESASPICGPSCTG